ncbi:hypothetical protein GCM10010234_76600 [Streptomyces hawaiiensis]
MPCGRAGAADPPAPDMRCAPRLLHAAEHLHSVWLCIGGKEFDIWPGESGRHRADRNNQPREAYNHMLCI